MKILVTGNAGFIGFHMVNLLLKKKFSVVGIDSINNYYDVNLKKKRLNQTKNIAKKYKSNYSFYKLDLCEQNKLKKIFEKYNFDFVIHLAAQAGVRYSLKNPHSYVKSNLVSFTNILENSRHFNVKHLLFASTSSVYGLDKKMPFDERFGSNHPIQFYAATKKANELMAHAYSHLFKLPVTGMRFFTVYGPWGRPDMALFKFVKNINENKPIEIYNNGNHERNFTYVDDIVKQVYLLIKKIPKGSKKDKYNVNESQNKFRILNIGGIKTTKLLDFINIIEDELGKKSKKKFLKLQDGDIIKTQAKVNNLLHLTKNNKFTDINVGVKNFIKWYQEFYINRKYDL